MLPMTPCTCCACAICGIPTSATHAMTASVGILKRRLLTPIGPASRRRGVCRAGLAAHGGGPVSAEPLVDKRHDLVERARLKPLLARDAPDEAVDAFDVLGPTEERACGRRWFAKTFGRLRIFLEGHEILVFRAKAVTQLRHPLVHRT